MAAKAALIAATAKASAARQRGETIDEACASLLGDPGSVPVAKVGTAVEYDSVSHGRWIPAKLVAFHAASGLYDLDCKTQVMPEKIRLPQASPTTSQLVEDAFEQGGQKGSSMPPLVEDDLDISFRAQPEHGDGVAAGHRPTLLGADLQGPDHDLDATCAPSRASLSSTSSSSDSSASGSSTPAQR